MVLIPLNNVLSFLPKIQLRCVSWKKTTEIRKSEFLKKLYKRNFHRCHGEMIVCITATDLHQDIWNYALRDRCAERVRIWTASSAGATYDITTRFFPQFHTLQMDRLTENYANSICLPHQFEYVGDPSQMRRVLTGTDRQTLSVATDDYFAVSRRHIRTRL